MSYKGAILLADRILLMTNGPCARVAESVTVDLATPRQRGQLIHDPGYYPIRNHLVDFLVTRSKDLAGSESTDGARQYPTEVNPVKAASATTPSALPAA